jgi:NADH-quinone oxidoreductase subunit D
LRKALPYEQYTNTTFKIPIGLQSDSYDRYFLRMEELRQSTNLILQGINSISSGPIKNSDNKYSSPSRADARNSMEALINHFKYYSQGFYLPDGDTYIATESPKGEFGVYLATDGAQNKPLRCKFRSPGYYHLQGLDFMTKNHLLADVVTIIGTQDIVFGEIDR